MSKAKSNFIWNRLNHKIKNSTNNNCENGGLKSVDIAAKISSLQSSWIKRLFDENFHHWEILALHIIHNNSLGKKFIFHSNLQVNKKLTKNFPKYYRKIINTWGSKFSCQTVVPFAILSQFL